MGGGFNPMEGVAINKCHFAIEDTKHWEAFCYKQLAERRKELKLIERQFWVGTWKGVTTFVTAIQKYRQIRKAMELEPHHCVWRVDHNRMREKYKALRETLSLKEEMMGTRQVLEYEEAKRVLDQQIKKCFELEKRFVKGRQNDAFLSKRVVERYQELNSLHFTKYLGNSYRTRFDVANTSYTRQQQQQKNAKWRVILESWIASSGSVSESKKDIKKPIDSAPLTRNNECGI